MNWEIPTIDTYFRTILEATPEGFELDHLAAALEHCQNFRTAVDGGAHIGTWSAALSKKFKKVFAFEPALDTFRCLQINTVHCTNLVQVNAALGAKEGTCFVEDDKTRQGNTGARYIQISEHGPMPVHRLDDYGLEDLDFLKLDLEGFETAALIGAEQTIYRCRPVIVAECKQFNPPRNGGTEATRQALSNLGYAEVGGIRNDRVFVPA